jgi:DNA-binding transcriptional regulator LsrR (DeoR family)
MMQEKATEVPVGLRRKTKSIPRLDLSKRLDIAYKSIINHVSQADLAKEFEVSQAVISNVVTKAKKKPELIREALDK